MRESNKLLFEAFKSECGLLYSNRRPKSSPYEDYNPLSTDFCLAPVGRHVSWGLPILEFCPCWVLAVKHLSQQAFIHHEYSWCTRTHTVGFHGANVFFLGKEENFPALP